MNRSRAGFGREPDDKTRKSERPFAVLEAADEDGPSGHLGRDVGGDDVVRDEVGRDRRGGGAARVGEGGLVAAHPVLCAGVGWVGVRST